MAIDHSYFTYAADQGWDRRPIVQYLMSKVPPDFWSQEKHWEWRRWDANSAQAFDLVLPHLPHGFSFGVTQYLYGTEGLQHLVRSLEKPTTPTPDTISLSLPPSHTRPVAATIALETLVQNNKGVRKLQFSPHRGPSRFTLVCFDCIVDALSASHNNNNNCHLLQELSLDFFFNCFQRRNLLRLIQCAPPSLIISNWSDNTWIAARPERYDKWLEYWEESRDEWEKCLEQSRLERLTISDMPLRNGRFVPFLHILAKVPQLKIVRFEECDHAEKTYCPREAAAAVGSILSRSKLESFALGNNLEIDYAIFWDHFKVNQTLKHLKLDCCFNEWNNGLDFVEVLKNDNMTLQSFTGRPGRPERGGDQGDELPPYLIYYYTLLNKCGRGQVRSAIHGMLGEPFDLVSLLANVTHNCAQSPAGNDYAGGEGVGDIVTCMLFELLREGVSLLAHSTTRNSGGMCGAEKLQLPASQKRKRVG